MFRTMICAAHEFSSPWGARKKNIIPMLAAHLQVGDREDKIGKPKDWQVSRPNIWIEEVLAELSCQHADPTIVPAALPVSRSTKVSLQARCQVRMSRWQHENLVP